MRSGPSPAKCRQWRRCLGRPASLDFRRVPCRPGPPRPSTSHPCTYLDPCSLIFLSSSSSTLATRLDPTDPNREKKTRRRDGRILLDLAPDGGRGARRPRIPPGKRATRQWQDVRRTGAQKGREKEGLEAGKDELERAAQQLAWRLGEGGRKSTTERTMADHSPTFYCSSRTPNRRRWESSRHPSPSPVSPPSRLR